MEEIYKMEGVGGMLEVFEDKLAITPKGMLGFLNKGLKGKKEIPFSSIVAVQFKEAGVLSGYLQFTILGGNESVGGIMGAAKDENTFMFAEKKDNEQIIEIKKYIESQIKQLKIPQEKQSKTSISDEILKLAKLKEEGILSDEEFSSAKKRLIEQ